MNGIVRHRQKAVCLVGGHIKNLPAGHHVVIHIDGIDRVRDQNGVVHIKQVKQVAQIALGAVRDENFAHVQFNAALRIILADGLTQELISLLTGDIAVESFLVALLLHGGVHRVHHRARERQRHIPDAKANHVPFGMCGLKIRNFVGNRAEKITLIQLGIVFVQFHCVPPVFLYFSYFSTKPGRVQPYCSVFIPPPCR